MPAHAVSAADLPDDIDALKGLVIAQAAREREYETELQCLREQLNLLLAKRFAPSSEKVSPDQLCLFNEAELDTAPAQEPVATIAVTAHERKRGGRKLPQSLPRVRIEHDLGESQKICPCSCALTRIGEETSEQLDIIPAQVSVLQHVRFTYVRIPTKVATHSGGKRPPVSPKENGRGFRRIRPSSV
jgi:transposase